MTSRHLAGALAGIAIMTGAAACSGEAPPPLEPSRAEAPPEASAPPEPSAEAPPESSASPEPSSEDPERVANLRDQAPDDPAPRDSTVVVDVTGRDLVRPEELEIAGDVAYEGLSWEGWGSDRAVGEGEATVLICRPTCAQGVRERWPGRVVLTDPKTCDGRRFYDRVAATFVTAEGEQVAQPYLGAPC